MNPHPTSPRVLQSSDEARLPVQLLIVESPDRTDECLSFRSEGALRICIVARDPGERPVELALRVIRRIAAIEASRAFVETVVLACDGAQMSQANAARRLVASAVMSHMAVAGKGRLVLLLGPGCKADARLEALELAGCLLVEAANTGISIMLRFADSEVDAPARSGIYPVVTAAAQ